MKLVSVVAAAALHNVGGNHQGRCKQLQQLTELAIIIMLADAWHTADVA
jgi:hypothetical protein